MTSVPPRARLTSASDPLLRVERLTVAFPQDGGWTPVVEDVSFDVHRSETVGIVGESGSGKTVTALALLGLTGLQGGRVRSGRVCFEGEEITAMTDAQLRGVRGHRMGIVFQQPVRSLNPAFSVGDQIAETIRRHLGLSRKDAWQRAVDLLDRMQIPDAARRARDYPHMFSGGMCQRVMIAIALACDPSLLVADEPTTALDVTVQSRILELLRQLQDETGVAILFISHDLAVIAEMCDRVVVMYAGQVVEAADAHDLFARPRHPYTSGLLDSIPRLRASRQLRAISGNVPAPGTPFPGCRFVPRCDHAVPGRCDVADPGLLRVDGAGRARCVRVDELELGGTA